MRAHLAPGLPTTLSLALCVLLAPDAAAQSNVRPAPALVRLPAAGAAYFAASAPRSARVSASTLWLRPLELTPGPFDTDPATLRELPSVPARQGFTRLELIGTSMPRADLERGGGDVSTTRGGWRATLGERIDDEVAFAIDLAAEASFYDFSGAGALQAGSQDPFNDVYDTRLGLSLMQDPTARTSWFSGVELRLSGEDDVSLGDALAVGAVAGVRHTSGEDLSVSIAVAALSRLEDDPWILPFLGFDWRVAERLRLVSEGSKVGAVLELSDALEARVGAEYAIRQFRLNDDSPLGGGVVQDEEILGGLRLDWSPDERWELGVEAGTVLWRELQTYGSGGLQLAEVETDGGAYARVSLRVSL